MNLLSEKIIETKPENFWKTQALLLILDIRDTLQEWRFWSYLGWYDIKSQYRRTIFGPIWLSLSMAIFILGFSYVGTRVFSSTVADYLFPFAIGHVTFIFFSTSLNESAQAFIAGAPYLKQIKVTKLSLILRVFYKNLIILSHNAIILLIIALIYANVRNINYIALVCSVCISFLFLIFACAIIAALAVRFRDVPMMLISIIQLLYFVTPIIWDPQKIGANSQWILYINPFYYVIESIRRPLMGNSIEFDIYFGMFTLLCGSIIIFFVLYLFVRRKITYWI